MTYAQRKLETQLCFPFYAVSRLITRAYQDDLDALGITYPQYLVMMVLWENDGVTVNEIAEKLILNTNTITPLLKRMETMGLLQRTQSKTDQRKVIVSLTDSGLAMEKLNVDTSEQSIQEMIGLKNKLYDLIKLLETIEK